MKTLVHLSLLLTLLMGIGTAHAAKRSVPMSLPSPFSIPDGVSVDQAKKAIRAALIGRRWEPLEVGPGTTDATLNVRQHMLKIRLTYHDGKVSMYYVDSAVLGYKQTDAGTYIHPSVMKWTNTLATDISAQLHAI